MVTFANGCGAVVTSPLANVAGFPIVGFGKGATPGEAYADATRKPSHRHRKRRLVQSRTCLHSAMI
ncbi:hypothetical protein AB0I35_14640 [Nocardia sp. NPDC050378]|uniref:hypothetical protein n=1 Tax=Nocardia sp. NPDC050378 TaxID=3155400 RepID=UPI0033DCD794